MSVLPTDSQGEAIYTNLTNVLLAFCSPAPMAHCQIGRDRFAAAPNVVCRLLVFRWFFGAPRGRKQIHSLPLATKVTVGMAPW
jgi:hypothetical protein